MNGSAIPDVDFDIGPSWAGLLPISGDANETRQVRRFFFLILLNQFSEEILRLSFPPPPPLAN